MSQLKLPVVDILDVPTYEVIHVSSAYEKLIRFIAGSTQELPAPVLEHVLDMVNALPEDSRILEFGVYKGDGCRLMAAKLPHHSIFGFDSFEGFETPWVDGHGKVLFDKGEFSLKGELPTVPATVSLVKGWFKDTLPAFVREHADIQVGLVHIDCDVYEATVDIFNCGDSLFRPGTVIVFDEAWNFAGHVLKGELLAFHEFLSRRTDLWFEVIGHGYDQGCIDRITDIHNAQQQRQVNSICEVRRRAGLPARLKYALAVKLVRRNPCLGCLL